MNKKYCNHCGEESPTGIWIQNRWFCNTCTTYNEITQNDTLGTKRGRRN